MRSNKENTLSRSLQSILFRSSVWAAPRAQYLIGTILIHLNCLSAQALCEGWEGHFFEKKIREIHNFLIGFVPQDFGTNGRKKYRLFCLITAIIGTPTLQATALKYKIELPTIWRNRMIQKYAGKKVVVTGGCGFIGSHLAAKLVDLGAQVTIIDNLSTGFEENIKNIKQDVTFIKKSVTDIDACLETTKGAEVIFHLAAFISVPKSLEEPRLCHEANIDGTFNVLEAARINGVKRLVFSSSSAVYGPTEERCAETNPTNPKSPYGFSKLIGEELCKQYTTNFGIETVMLRYFNVYGPRQNPNGAYAAVVARFSDQLKNNSAITIFGNGLQTRDFVPVSQVVDANLISGISDAADVSGEIFNVATGTSITLLELVDQLRVNYPESTSTIVFGPERSAVEVQHTSANVNKFMNLIQQ